MDFVCELCGVGFRYKRYLSQHKSRFHNIKAIKEFTCNVCDKQYGSKSSLSNHATLHRGKRFSFECKEENCDQKFHTLNELRIHLRSDHGILDIEVCQNLAFVKYEDFNAWLVEEERKTNSKYVKSGAMARNDCKYITFSCNRSGVYKPTTHNRQRKLKAQGSVKLGFRCTSSINVKELGSKVMVSYYKGHYKHTSDLSHLPIHKTDKKVIAGKLQCVKKKRIIKVEESSDEKFSDAVESIKSLWNSIPLHSFSNMDENVAIQVKHHMEMIKNSINAIRHLMSSSNCPSNKSEVPNKKIELSKLSSLETLQKAD